WIFAAPLALTIASACNPESPQRGPEQTCAKACETRAAATCSPEECRRGCNFVIDRLTNHEGDHVIACIAKADRHACDDRAWARCATLIGPHADGGPPAPPPPVDDDFEEEE
ncbi:MAG: hypothetical protein ACREJ3_16375, partial [Polyangiaceae bacterium]